MHSLICNGKECYKKKEKDITYDNKKAKVYYINNVHCLKTKINSTAQRKQRQKKSKAWMFSIYFTLSFSNKKCPIFFIYILGTYFQLFFTTWYKSLILIDIIDKCCILLMPIVISNKFVSVFNLLFHLLCMINILQVTFPLSQN